MIAADPQAEPFIRRFLRGQDIDRWSSEWAGLWMIFSRQGTKIDDFPAVRMHLQQFQSRLEPKPKGWMGENWTGRKAGPYRWWEIQDQVVYWEMFSKPKVLIQRILFHPGFCLDFDGLLCNDAAIFVPSQDRWLVTVLNSPAAWWLMFRTFPHKKDEALAMDIPFVRLFPVPTPAAGQDELAAKHVVSLETNSRLRRQATAVLRDWLRITWDLPMPPATLLDPFHLTADQFAQALRAALPARRRTLSAAAIAAIRAEHAATVAPMAARLAEAARHEAALSALVNRAYGLTPEEEALMWATAPPRMPVPPPAPAP